MYSMSNLVIALLIGGGIGGVAGWYLAMTSRGDNKRKVIMDLESQLDQAKQGRADFEAEVSEHFAQTADLLHKLTDDYRAVYTHLANGAEQLCGDRVSMSEAALTASADDDGRQTPFGRHGTAAGLRPEKARRAGATVRNFWAG